MKSKKVEVSCDAGDLIRITDADIVESFVELTPNVDGILYGFAVELCEPDPDGNEGEDVWIVLVGGVMWKMLRYEFEVIQHR